MKVAVTGGAGFIGRAVCNQLLEHGHEPLVIDRNQGQDVTDLATFGDLLSRCDAVIHLAGILGTSEMFAFPLRSIDTNIVGTLNVLHVCAYERVSYVGITMPDSQWPSIYQATKLAATRLASAYHHRYGIPTTHIRAFNAYGRGQAHTPTPLPATPGTTPTLTPGRGTTPTPHAMGTTPTPPTSGPAHTHPKKIIPTLAWHSWHHEPMPIYGDGTQTVDLVHVDHIAHCLVFAATSPEHIATGTHTGTGTTHTGTTNIGSDVTWDAGSGVELSVNEVATMVGDVTGNHEVTHLPMRDGETPHTSLCAKDPGPFGFDELDLARFAQVVRSYRP